MFLVKDVQTQQYYAMKRMVVDEGERLDNAEAEIKIMESLPSSKYLVKLLAWDVIRVEEMFEVRVLLEYCAGTLRCRVVSRTSMVLRTPLFVVVAHRG